MSLIYDRINVYYIGLTLKKSIKIG